jgi:hypothetical protein
MQAASLRSSPPVHGDAVLSLALCVCPPRLLVSRESGQLSVYPLPAACGAESRA